MKLLFSDSRIIITACENGLIFMIVLKITFNPSEGYRDSLRKKTGNIIKFMVVAKFSTVPLNAEIINPIMLDKSPTIIREIKNIGLNSVVGSRKPNKIAIMEKIDI